MRALVPIVVLALAWLGCCLYDLSRSSTRHLPKRVWAAPIVVSVAFGQVASLAAGRRR